MMDLIIFMVIFLLFSIGNTPLGLQDWYFKSNNFNPDIWTLYGGIDNFNIAFPDVGASYMGSFISLKEGETIILESDIPYARYYSVQLYDSSMSSLGSLNDEMIHTKNGKFQINITKSVQNNVTYNFTNLFLNIYLKNKTITKFNTTTNTTLNNTLIIKSDDTLLLLIFRVYDVYDQTILKKQNVSTKNKIESFGWISPPNISKHFANNKIIKLNCASHFTKIGFPKFYNDKLPPKKSKYDNLNNSFFKAHSGGYFANNDAHYLISTINFNKTNGKIIGAIIRGYLPIVQYNYSINHAINHIPNHTLNNTCKFNDTYEVRYVSFNMGALSSPFPTVAGESLKLLNSEKINKSHVSSTGKPGIRDIDIIARYNNSNEWNKKGRPYVIYIGANITHIKKLGGDPNNDLYMIFPVDQNTGKLFTFPVIIFRHLMPHHTFNYGIDKIKNQIASPIECHNVMKKYYPTINFI